MSEPVETGAIADAGDGYGDIRWSAHPPTVELRVCDAIPLIDDAIILHLPSATAEMYCSADLIGVNHPRDLSTPVER